LPVSPRDPAIDRYLDGLLAEIAAKITRYGVHEIPSVYIGGGTPSILGVHGISRLLSEIMRGTAGRLLMPGAEITVEVNPDTIDMPFLLAAQSGGVTRVSIGVQTFDDISRKAVGRTGSGRMMQEKLMLLSGIFPGAFSADLMSGLPGQNEAVLMKDIETLLRYRPAHISLYDLIPHGNLPGLLPEDEKAGLWIKGRDTLTGSGYEQYEVSNFALSADARSAHNIRYWLMHNWIGAGKTASGTIIDDEKGEGFRESDGCIETLDSDTLIKETFLMGFRFCEGPDRELFTRRFKKTIEETIPVSLAKGERDGLIRKGTTKPEKRGFLFLDSFLKDCFLEIAGER
jgi:oxygen-independent coproporphyrinogen-3 oxidase